jgi:hypothetical protein
MLGLVSTATVDVSSRVTVHALVQTATGLGDVTGVIYAAGGPRPGVGRSQDDEEPELDALAAGGKQLPCHRTFVQVGDPEADWLRGQQIMTNSSTCSLCGMYFKDSDLLLQYVP